MKLAHYLHIAPRTVFWAQGIATAVGAIVQCGVTVFLITHIDGICEINAAGGYTCPHGRVTYSSSLIWGKFCDLGPANSYTTNIALYRRLGTREKLLSRSTLWQLAVFLPRRPCRHSPDMSFISQMEDLQTMYPGPSSLALWVWFRQPQALNFRLGGLLT